jgi:hypothetical protein
MLLKGRIAAQQTPGLRTVKREWRIGFMLRKIQRSMHFQAMVYTKLVETE